MWIRIKNLRLRTIIGVNDWEREIPQDVVIQIAMEVEDPSPSDDLADTVDYKRLKRRIVALVEGSRHRLVERLAQEILDAVMEEPQVKRATIEVDKPHALRYADSVSVVLEKARPDASPQEQP